MLNRMRCFTLQLNMFCQLTVDECVAWSRVIHLRNLHKVVPAGGVFVVRAWERISKLPTAPVASHDVVHVVGRRMHHCIQQVTADAARHNVCQLRSGNVTVRCLMRVVTPARADCGVLRGRCWGRDHVLALAEDAGGISISRVAAPRLVQRADVSRQRVWCRHVGVLYADPCCGIHCQHSRLPPTQFNSLAAQAQHRFWPR